jgi:hypothetical protein
MKVKRQQPLNSLLELASVENLRKLINALVSRRSKSLVVTETGIRRAQRLAAAVSDALAHRSPAPPAQV